MNQVESGFQTKPNQNETKKSFLTYESVQMIKNAFKRQAVQVNSLIQLFDLEIWLETQLNCLWIETKENICIHTHTVIYTSRSTLITIAAYTKPRELFLRVQMESVSLMLFISAYKNISQQNLRFRDIVLKEQTMGEKNNESE